MDPREWPGRLGRRVAGAVRRAAKLWARRRLSETDIQRSLETAYAAGDPWRMTSRREQHRFSETNRILLTQVIAPATKVGSILEIGCGEGHQSEHLRLLCDRLTGIDVVGSAIARARVRVPDAELILGELDAQPWIDERGRFDLVTGFEVIYYFRDVPRVLETMSRLGRACMVTYHGPAVPLLEQPLSRLPLAGTARIRHGDVEWHAAWWRSAG